MSAWRSAARRYHCHCCASGAPCGMFRCRLLCRCQLRGRASCVFCRCVFCCRVLCCGILGCRIFCGRVLCGRIFRCCVFRRRTLRLCVLCCRILRRCVLRCVFRRRALSCRFFFWEISSRHSVELSAV